MLPAVTPGARLQHRDGLPRRAADMSRGVECFGRAGGVEYAAAGPVTVPPLEAAMSLARNLGTDVPTAGAMLMRADAGDASDCRARRSSSATASLGKRPHTGGSGLAGPGGTNARSASRRTRTTDVAMLRERPEAPRPKWQRYRNRPRMRCGQCGIELPEHGYSCPSRYQVLASAESIAETREALMAWATSPGAPDRVRPRRGRRRRRRG